MIRSNDRLSYRGSNLLAVIRYIKYQSVSSYRASSYIGIAANIYMTLLYILGMTSNQNVQFYMLVQ